MLREISLLELSVKSKPRVNKVIYFTFFLNINGRGLNLKLILSLSLMFPETNEFHMNVRLTNTSVVIQMLLLFK